MHLVRFTMEKKKVPWDMENCFRDWGQWSRLFNNNSRHTDHPCGVEGCAECSVQSAVSRVGPERQQFEDIAVYAGPQILDVFKISLVSIHPHVTFYLPRQLRAM